MSQQPCFHCNEPVLTGNQFITRIDGKDEIMCCPGCQAVSQAIVDAGLLSYYTYRTEPGSRQTALVPESLNHYSAYDLPEVQQDFVHGRDGLDEVTLSIDGITCAACAWLIEHKLQHVEGVERIQVNSTTQRAFIRWQPGKIKLSELLSAIGSIGYSAAPFQLDDQEVVAKRNTRRFLLRLGLAGFATMQVMMFALALYAGYFTDLETEFRDYFRWVSMIFAAPVVFYSAQPFYFSAIRAILSGKLNMDVSVSIAICGAYIASCVATINGTGEVYFESVSMFTFFLLLGRYFEQNARQKASVSSSNLHKLVPLTASLVTDSGVEEIPAKKLAVGDVILVSPGDVIAADGAVVDGLSGVNESMLTGEQLPIAKGIGAEVYAGTINLEQPLKVKVTATGQDQLVAEIIRLQEMASNAKPAIALTADKLARYFSATILTIAAITYVVWRQFAPEDAFWVTLSVLVATCPCALALATPTAVTCATGLFTRLGIISRNGSVFEKLPRLNQVVFDKTGTLTCGHFSLGEVKLFSEMDKDQALAIASALEKGSLHPIAKLFSQFPTKFSAAEPATQVGFGVSGLIDGSRYYIGSGEYLEVAVASKLTGQWVYLGNDTGLIAAFEIQDKLRDDARHTLDTLRASGLGVSIASGDTSLHLSNVANTLGVNDVHGGLKPADKLAFIEKHRSEGKVVAMFGDGINDAPVLAGADLSVAMGSGSAVAKNSADLILLGDHLSRFIDAVTIARSTNRIIRQNLAWALGYNVFILPLAVTGHVVPYIAAIGMSASSLIVVGNSLRLLRLKP
ncbi:heavy metal translocating P-type ATPase [Shewanella khirikhana]|uniref:Copper-importing P-type ATPase A n=1 Tax=Shewanella khirikhana TaxID=1965282 RepID=A0ABM7DND8_9GAMM|nr:heavy metal translocating P-type ATPase metal-binding domain-containing protein [Shewanella khirikhana]AZQ10595.1 putative copper-importing P-type ATPase A [Shewanella khirikhana]